MRGTSFSRSRPLHAAHTARLFSLLVALGSLPAGQAALAEEQTWSFQTETWQLEMGRKPVPPIPLEAPETMEQMKSKPGMLAYLASNGNLVVQRVRDTQETMVWFSGRIGPIASLDEHADDTFLWPQTHRLVLLISGGGVVPVREILAMKGFTLSTFACQIAFLYPSKNPIAYRDIMMESPRGKICSIYLGFPKTFDPTKAEEIDLLPKEDVEKKDAGKGGDGQ
ncbi:MAG: hypothetical protein ACE15D_07340 [Candidatus Eisenbacteria bacterium]|nr:hypothetical protein [Candidatus Eisenbacteria bacterium]